MASKETGKVYLVGAGPGHADAISVRGRDLLKRADEVLYDYLVNPELLDHTKPEAECVCLGRHGRASLWKPAEIHARMVKSALQGLEVVRLKSGDPLVFGRASAELAALTDANVPFEIVPGITAAMAVPSFAGIPITDRDQASAVAFVTGQEDPRKPESQLDFSKLAQFPGTLVIYMGVTTAAHWTGQLLENGASPDLPVALVRRCGWPNQEVIRCRLGDVVERVTPYSKFPPPVLAIVGEVAAQANSDFDWFSRRPLFGQSILLTRPRRQAEESRRRLSELGAEVILQPAVEIEPVEFDVEDQLDTLSDFEAVVMTSANGVEHFLDPIWARGVDMRTLAGLQLIAIGPATTRKLADYHLRGDSMPSDRRFNSEALLELLTASTARSRRILIVRGETGREVLAPGLREAGHFVKELTVYRTCPVAEPEERVLELLSKQSVDWVFATSSALAAESVRLLGDRAHECRWVSISQRTSETLRDFQIEPAAEADEATIEGMIRALCRLINAPYHS